MPGRLVFASVIGLSAGDTDADQVRFDLVSGLGFQPAIEPKGNVPAASMIRSTTISLSTKFVLLRRVMVTILSPPAKDHNAIGIVREATSCRWASFTSKICNEHATSMAHGNVTGFFADDLKIASCDAQ